MSLRWFHFVFILASIVLADGFGLWALKHASQDGSLRWMGIASFGLSFVLTVYLVWFMIKARRPSA